MQSPEPSFHSIEASANESATAAVLGGDDRPMLALEPDATSSSAASAPSTNEQRLQWIVDELPHIVWTAQPDGAWDYLNAHWQHYTGLSFEQSKGWNWQAALHSDDRPQTVQQWRHALQNGQSCQIECRLQQASDGAFHWHRLRVRPQHNDAGQIVLWVGIGTEIGTEIDEQKRSDEAVDHRVRERTADIESAHFQLSQTSRSLRDENAHHQQAEAALQQALLLAESVAETVREPLLVLDNELRIATANRSFYRTFGIEKAKTEQCRLPELGEGEWNVPELEAQLREVLATGVPLEDFEMDAGLFARHHQSQAVCSHRTGTCGSYRRLRLDEAFGRDGRTGGNRRVASCAGRRDADAATVSKFDR